MFGWLRKKPKRVPITKMCAPSLVTQLMSAEKREGRPLTQEEVESIRDRSPAIQIEVPDLRALESDRGFRDIHPEHAWDEWRAFREGRLSLDV